MRNRLLAAAVMLGGLSVPATAQLATMVGPQIVTTGNGEAMVTPDRATIMIGVQSRASTAAPSTGLRSSGPTPTTVTTSSAEAGSSQARSIAGVRQCSASGSPWMDSLRTARWSTCSSPTAGSTPWCCAGRTRPTSTRRTAGRPRPALSRPYRVAGYPWVPALFVVAMTGLVLNTLYERPLQSLFGVGLVALGVPFFRWRRMPAAG